MGHRTECHAAWHVFPLVQAPPWTPHVCRGWAAWGPHSPPPAGFSISSGCFSRYPAHSQVPIAPGPAGTGPVTWLFSQPGLVTRGCLVSATAINCCTTSSFGLQVPLFHPNPRPVFLCHVFLYTIWKSYNSSKDKQPCYLEFSACLLISSWWVESK